MSPDNRLFRYHCGGQETDCPSASNSLQRSAAKTSSFGSHQNLRVHAIGMIAFQEFAVSGLKIRPVT
jgi:hypothetical protein